MQKSHQQPPISSTASTGNFAYVNPANMLPNIAPAPPQGQQPGQQQQQHHPMNQQTAAGQPGQIAGQPGMAPGQPMAQMGHMPQQGQFLVSPHSFGANGAATAQAQFPMGQYAAYNQQGQLVMMPFQMSASPQAGQQQPNIIYMTTGHQQQQQQQHQQQQQQPKPGQPMLVQQNNSTGKPMQVPAHSQSYTMQNGTMVATSGGGQPQFVIANPIPGQPGIPVTMASQMKQLQADQKGTVVTSMANTGTQHHVSHVQSGQANLGQTPQPIVLPHGMAYQGGGILQGNQLMQLVQRSPASQDPNNPQQPGTPIMFPPQTAQSQSPMQHPQQQGQMQTNPQLPTHALQPMTMTMTRPPMSQFQPINQPAVVSKASKTPISRALPMIRPGFPNTPGLPGQLQPQMQVFGQPQPYQAPSPKSKTKMSPRTGGPIGRPPGPAKAAMNALKNTTPMVVTSPMAPMAPPIPRLPANVVASITTAMPGMMVGPPVLQTSQVVLPPPISSQVQQQINSQYGGPPKLQPMAPAPPPPAAAAAADDTKEKLEDKDSVMAESDPKPSGSDATPKAVVKPNVLAHMIDGHVIMESSQPFPIDKEDKGNVAVTVYRLHLGKLSLSVHGGNACISA
jgi:hypothetical protein